LRESAALTAVIELMETKSKLGFEEADQQSAEG
jgi:hypothetical protein